jgi:DNA-directed RNA polymerase subunit M/transcription elongation factor TFIIS
MSYIKALAQNLDKDELSECFHDIIRSTFENKESDHAHKKADDVESIIFEKSSHSTVNDEMFLSTYYKLMRQILNRLHRNACVMNENGNAQVMNITYAELIYDGEMSPVDLVEGNMYNICNPQKTYIDLFFDILYKYTKSEEVSMNIARTIESSCYNSLIKDFYQNTSNADKYQWGTKKFIDAYSTRCGNVRSNLNPDSYIDKGHNYWMLEHIFSGDIDPNDIGIMRTEELRPDISAEERNEINDILTQEIKKVISHLYQCPTCHERACTYVEIQIRSSDEPKTLICTCCECETIWEVKN